MTSGLQMRLRQAAGQRLQADGRRHRRALQALGNMQVSDGQGRWVNFSGNDYLAMAREPAVAARLAEAAARSGAGSGASALVSGYHPQHQALERELAEFLERDAALLCPAGFLANLAVLTSLAGRGDTIVQDRLCHASLVDAGRMSGARLRRYRHCDIAGAGRQLATATGHRLLVSDGVFSMDGDCAPLRELAELAAGSDATLVVDDAHGIGVIGPGGRGLVGQSGLGQREVPVLTGTLGKAFGTAGAFIAGSKELIEHLVNAGRSYVYTTAQPPALAAAAREALRRVARADRQRDELQARIAQLRDGARQRGLPLMASTTPIQPLVLGDAATALHWSAQLAERGYLVVAMRPPTVPEGSSRLRITLSSGHSAAQVEGLLDALVGCLP